MPQALRSVGCCLARFNRVASAGISERGCCTAACLRPILSSWELQLRHSLRVQIAAANCFYPSPCHPRRSLFRLVASPLLSLFLPTTSTVISRGVCIHSSEPSHYMSGMSADGFIAGSVCIALRGRVTLDTKVRNCSSAGAAAVIIIDTTGDAIGPDLDDCSRCFGARRRLPHRTSSCCFSRVLGTYFTSALLWDASPLLLLALELSISCACAPGAVPFPPCFASGLFEPLQRKSDLSVAAAHLHRASTCSEASYAQHPMPLPPASVSCPTIPGASFCRHPLPCSPSRSLLESARCRQRC
jgi:hypothetical protein